MIEARAVKIAGRGDVDVLSIGAIAVREPGAGELLVAVAAAGLNRADILQRRGFYPAPAGVVADVPGLEYAGEVAALGPGGRGFAVGDRVMGITAGGAMSTHLVVHEREAMAVPEGMSLEHAAAIPEVFLTAFDALFVGAGLGLGDKLLVHAGASGVGTAALQLGRAAGAEVLATTRTAAKRELCQELGAGSVVVVGEAGFAAEVMAATGGRGVDVILDTVGAAYLDDNLRALAMRGRIVVVGLLGGASGELALATMLKKRATIVGTVLRSRPLEEKAALAQRFSAQVLPGFASGALVPVIDSILPMESIAAAHRQMESNQLAGKIVLRWED